MSRLNNHNLAACKRCVNFWPGRAECAIFLDHMLPFLDADGQCRCWSPLPENERGITFSEAGRRGGDKTLARHGREHFERISKLGTAARWKEAEI